MSRSGPREAPTCEHPRSPITPEAPKELWPPPPPTTGDAAPPRALPQIGSREREAQVGAVRLGFGVDGVHAEARGRRAPGARRRGGARAPAAAESESRSRASTLDEDLTTSTSSSASSTCLGAARQNGASRKPRARIAELERQLDRRTARTGPGSAGTRSPADARAPIELEITTPPPPPPPSSPFVASCPTPVVSGAFSGPGSRLWSMIARPGLLAPAGAPRDALTRRHAASSIRRGCTTTPSGRHGDPGSRRSTAARRRWAPGRSAVPESGGERLPALKTDAAVAALHDDRVFSGDAAT